jgi:hypothetical protein
MEQHASLAVALDDELDIASALRLPETVGSIAPGIDGLLSIDLSRMIHPRWGTICGIVDAIETLRARGRSVRAIASSRIRTLLVTAGLAAGLIDAPGTVVFDRIFLLQPRAAVG